ncbi:MAG: hypothetical protein MJ050_06890, partial [Phascolarctobacterium sp.]|nr:hypothetical protein [Phascolarctobacterium sp.]
MKLRFNKLVTTDNKVTVSFDKGNTFTTYNNDTVLTDGIPFTMEDCNNDLSNIVVKGKVKSLTDIDVIKQIDESDDSSETINVEIKTDNYRGLYASINNVDFYNYTGEYTIYIGSQNINDSIDIEDLKNNDILSVDFNTGLSLS